MPREDVTGVMAEEITKLLRAAAQMGGFLADRRRQALRRAAAVSEQQHRAVQDATETERRLAEPVWRRAFDERFWERTEPAEAAFVYGVAARFQTIDPLAAMAARTCETEAATRWGARLGGGRDAAASHAPVSGADVDARAAAAVAPALDGEERDWPRVLEESASARAEQTRTGGADRAEAQRQEEASVSALTAVLGSYPQVDSVRVERVTTPRGPSVAFQALDRAGERVPEAESDLGEVTALAVSPAIMSQRLGDRTLSRADLEDLAATPLLRAASAPGQQPQGAVAAARAQAPGTDLQQEAAAPRSQGSGGIAEEEERAWAWFNEHYDATELMPYADEHQRRQCAHATWSAMAAEGVDLDSPPRISGLDGRVRDSWQAQTGAHAQLADALGVDAASVAGRVDHRALAPMARAWEIEQDGGWPELGAWAFNVASKGSEAMDEVAGAGEVRLVGDSPAPGTYTELAREAAGAEAERAGMDVDTYLDHLQPVQRRAVIAAHTDGRRGYEDSLARASSYRVAYARESARTRPTWSARAGREQDQQSRTTAQAPAASSRPSSSTRAPWDSREARDAWAADKVDQGLPASAVRAARTGDTAMHEPPARATAPRRAGRPARGGHRPAHRPRSRSSRRRL